MLVASLSLMSAFTAPVTAGRMITAASDVGDPDATRMVYVTVVALAALGVVLAGLAIWLLRRTRPEPELLSPLETMATRGWRKLDPAAQRRSLDEARPANALPLRREASEPAVDSSFATVAPVASFDDLSEHAPDPDIGDADHAEDPIGDDDLDTHDTGEQDIDALDTGEQDIEQHGDDEDGDVDADARSPMLLDDGGSIDPLSTLESGSPDTAS